MFSYYYNYIIFLFNPELLVLICFFLFLFCVILQEKGQLGSYLQELSIDARLKIERHLFIRETIILELAHYLERSVNTIKKIMASYESASLDTLVCFQHTIKKLLFTYTILQIKYFLSSIEDRTQSLFLQIRFYLTHELFVNKSYNLVYASNTIKKIKVVNF